MNPRILSIDWDFFFPNILNYDWGHREEPLYQITLWPIRATNRNIFTGAWAVDECRPDLTLLKNFWRNVLVDWRKVHLWIAESHADMYHLLEFLGLTNAMVRNLDQHHDVHYGKVGPEPRCDNWVGKSVEEGKIKSYQLFYPPWRKDKPEFDEPPIVKTSKDWFWETRYGLPPKGNYDVVFICRSSAWTPSWADKDWLTFIRWWKNKSPWRRMVTAPFVHLTRNPNLKEAIQLRDQHQQMVKEHLNFNY